MASQLSRKLLRAAFEPTMLSLETASGSPGYPLLIRVAAPPAINACDIKLEIEQPWYSPFRLARVAMRLPAEIASLNSADFDSAIQSLVRNMTAEATLEPCLADHSIGEGVFPHLMRLQTAVAVLRTDPRYGRCVLIEIPVPAGITLRPGAAISLSVSIAGSPITLRIAAASHIHSTTCNHKRGPIGAVWMAASEGDVAALEAALAAGGSTEEALGYDEDDDDSGTTALDVAACEGHAEAVRILLAAGARVRNTGSTPLHLAVESLRGHLAVVQALLGDPRASACLRARNGHGYTPLDLAAERGHTAVVQALLGDPRVDPGARDAVRGGGTLGMPVRQEPASVGARRGWTPIQWAAVEGHTAVVQVFLGDPRVDPGECDKDGFTPLHGAAYDGYTAVVQALLGDPRVDPGARTTDGKTPLDYAKARGHAVIVRMLEAARSAAAAP